MNEVTIFSPATVANVNCGFDVLGFAFDGIGDEMTLRKASRKGITITKIEGAELPYNTELNVAGVAGMALLDHLDLDHGFEIEIEKNIPLGSGIGSSAASAAGVVFGINQFLNKPLSLQELSYYAMKGEVVASGHEHADNVAPSIIGGITLIPGYDPFQVISLPVPADLFVTVIHPHTVVNTKEAREILPALVPLKDAITQSGNIAGFITSLFKSDYQLMQRSLKDVLIEPHRKSLIPLFDNAKRAALKNKALAFGISGSGPSVFAMSESKEVAQNVSDALADLYKSSNIITDNYVSRISPIGSKIIE